MVGPLSDFWLRQHVSISYEVTVPPQTEVQARSGPGSQSIDGIRGALDARAGSGSIRIGHLGGHVSAAASGDIRIDGNPTGDWRVRTGSGSVNVHVPRDARFDLDVRTGSGTIHTEHPVELLGSVSRRSIQGRVRGGGARLEISTGSGTMRID